MMCFAQASSACQGPPNSSFFRGLSHLSPQVLSQFNSPGFHQQMSHNNATPGFQQQMSHINATPGFQQQMSQINVTPGFQQQMSPNNATSFSPMPQQGFTPWSANNANEEGPSEAQQPGRVIPVI